jgi:hypothetical protein
VYFGYKDKMYFVCAFRTRPAQWLYVEIHSIGDTYGSLAEDGGIVAKGYDSIGLTCQSSAKHFVYEQLQTRFKRKPHVFSIVGIGGYFHCYFDTASMQCTEKVNGPRIGVVERANIHKVYSVFFSPIYYTTIAISLFEGGKYSGSVVANGCVVDIAYAVFLLVDRVGTQSYLVSIGSETLHLTLYLFTYTAMG